MEQSRITLKDTVHNVLSECPKARDNSTILIMQTLRKLGFKIYVEYGDIPDMPSFEAITRCCRKIQNDDKELLPSSEVDKRRKEAEEQYREDAANGRIGTGAHYNAKIN